VETYQATIDVGGNVGAVGELPVDALSLGRGVFETMLVINGRAALAGEHAARLARSCEALAIASPDEAKRLFDAALNWLRDIAPERARFRVAVFGHAGKEAPLALTALADAGEPRRETTLGIARGRRAPSPLTIHKCVDYLADSLSREEAIAEGFDDALWLDVDGNVAETSTANIFFMADGPLVTPETGCILPGVVRKWIIEEAPRAGVEVSERAIASCEIADFRHAFVTNSIIGLVPVSRIGDARFEDLSTRDWFARLLSSWEAALAESP
jgi:4-amino-4-deoxychorismate lyase